MNEPKYRRVLLKISGEALAGDAHRGLNFDVIGSVCDVVKQCVEAGVQVGIVVGGGNFWRGMKDGGRHSRTRCGRLVSRKNTTSLRWRMMSHASARHGSASSKKKSEVMQTRICSPLWIL